VPLKWETNNDSLAHRRPEPREHQRSKAPTLLTRNRNVAVGQKRRGSTATRSKSTFPYHDNRYRL